MYYLRLVSIMLESDQYLAIYTFSTFQLQWNVDKIDILITIVLRFQEHIIGLHTNKLILVNK
jgi:hypothetical protein